MADREEPEDGAGASPEDSGAEAAAENGSSAQESPEDDGRGGAEGDSPEAALEHPEASADEPEKAKADSAADPVEQGAGPSPNEVAADLEEQAAASLEAEAAAPEPEDGRGEPPAAPARSGPPEFSGPGGRRRRAEGPAIRLLDYKDVRMLSYFITDQGKILPKRTTRVPAGLQRKLARAVKRARYLALIPYTGSFDS